MQQLYEPYRIRYIILGGLRRTKGQYKWVLYRQTRPQRSCFPGGWAGRVCARVRTSVCVRVSVCPFLAVPLFWTHSHLLWG